MTIWRKTTTVPGEMVGRSAGGRVHSNLNAVMEFDTVVWSDGRGAVWDEVPVYAPEVVGDDDDELTACAERQGWTLLSGWTGQHGYGGPQMHASEYVGGGLANHILETEGFYVAVALLADDDEHAACAYCEAGETSEHNPEPPPDGGSDDSWVIAYRLNPYNPDDFPQEKER